MPCGKVKKIEWENIRNSYNIDSNLIKALDGIYDSLKTNGLETHLYIADYQYGNLIVDNGELRTPCSKKSCCDECTQFLRELKYSPIPLSLILHNAIEVYTVNTTMKRDTLSILKTDDMFGVFETLDKLSEDEEDIEPPPWYLSSGARSIELVMPLNNTKFPKMLAKKLGVGQIDSELWYEYKSNHWQLFEFISNVKNHKYETKVLFFPKIWIFGEGDVFNKLHINIYKIGWEQSRATRQNLIDISRIENILHAHVKDTTADSLETLLYSFISRLNQICKSQYPAFAPVNTRLTQLGPFVDGQLYLAQVADETNEKKLPLVLQPQYIDSKNTNVFYSVKHHKNLLANTAAMRIRDDFINDVCKSVAKLSRHPSFDYFTKYQLSSLFSYVKAQCNVNEWIDSDIINEYNSLKLDIRGNGSLSSYVRISK